jgi:RNA polymerase sigma-70 factor (ECF subfamily)
MSPDQRPDLESLFQEHAPRLRAWLARRLPTSLRRRLDCDDILQEAFLLARAKFPAYQASPDLAPYPWLLRAVRDCYLRQWDKNTRECRNHLQELPWPDGSSLQLGLGLISGGPSPSDGAAREEVRARVLRAVQALSADDRELLDLRYWEGLPFADVGAVLGIREEAARVRHARALKRFAALWEGEP